MELYDEVIGVNLTGSFLACKFAIPALIERGGGSIVNIGSIAGIRDSGTSHPAYCASKAAQLGLTIDLAGAYGRDNVRVNTVLPGIIATPMLASVGTVADDVRARLNLLGRMGTAWDIANAVVFLCSDEASYITGVTLPVDGGATAGMPGSAFRSGSVASRACSAGTCTATRTARRTSRRSSCPVRESYAGTVRGLTDIPVTTMGMGQFIGRKPDVGVHNAPRRQFLVVLQGELEIVTTLGRSERLRPGRRAARRRRREQGSHQPRRRRRPVDAHGDRDRPGVGTRTLNK